MPSYQELKTEADSRWQALESGEKPWIRVGTAMCAHAAGAFQVIDALKAELAERGIDANVDEVGCLGLCYAEPLVDILKPGSSRLFFRDVTPDDVPDIIESYLVNDRVPQDKVIGYLGDAAISRVPDLNTLPGMAYQELLSQ